MILSQSMQARSVGYAAVSVWLTVVGVACSSPPEARTAEEVKLTESGGRHEPEDETEREILSLLDQLAADQARPVHGYTVRAGAAYASATGRPCREVQLEATSGASSGGAKASTTRLACRDADSWFFVPDVFGAGSGGP